MRPFQHVIRPLAALLCATVLQSCDDAALQPEPAETSATELSARGGAVSNDWLAIDDVRSPTNWLIERSSGRDFVGDDPRVPVVDQALDTAQAMFHENRRMLANRTAQLTDVSREQGEPMLPEDLLKDLSYPQTSPGKSWFGVRAQAYIVLRQTGGTHAEAVAAMIQQAERQP